VTETVITGWSVFFFRSPQTPTGPPVSHPTNHQYTRGKYCQPNTDETGRLSFDVKQVLKYPFTSFLIAVVGQGSVRPGSEPYLHKNKECQLDTEIPISIIQCVK